jgi:YidC/Oxa1 family membrane protein insertase
MDQRNLFLAIAISAVIYIGFYFLYEKPRLEQMQAQQQAAQEAQQAQQAQQQQQQQQQPTPGAAAPGTLPGTAATATAPALVDRDAALKQSPRVVIDSPRLKGSIALKGGRLDDVVLADYRETVDPNSPNIVLLSPAAAANAYFAEFGWVGQGTTLPHDTTVWQADGDKLTPDKPLTLSWDNGAGVRFLRVFALDRNFMLTVTQRVENGSAAPLTLYPYGRIRRVGTPALGISQILHEGPIGAFGNLVGDGKYSLKERQYHDLREDGPCDAQNAVNRHESVGGWLGITDKYWLVALVPDAGQRLTACYRWELADGKDTYQVDYLGAELGVTPAGTAEVPARLFAGAKEVRLLDDYRDGRFGDAPIPLFDRAVDFAGYLGYFLTLIAKPLFYLLDIIYSAVGNFGIAIMLLTVLVKIAFFWLANKSYRAMNKMKKLAPLMQELRQRFGEDKARLNQEMMALYKREKVNPAAGCLPIVVQIPVFIALYQVLYVTIEMRHAPFFGWIRDLSAPDPTSVLNLFGLLPYSVLLPIVFTFMLAPFAAGLVIYWAWNNLLSIAQQWLLKRLDERAEAQAAARKLEQKSEKQAEAKPEQPAEEPEDVAQATAEPALEKTEKRPARKPKKRM